MPKKRIIITILINLLLLISFFAGSLNAAPHWGDKFQLKQPDDSRVTVVVWGDEFYQDIESIDGYTLIRDPQTEWICYAELSSDGSEYLSTGQVYLANEQEPPVFRDKKSEEKIKQTLKKHLRINNKSREEKANRKREELLGEDFSFNPAENILVNDQSRSTITGLTILIDFPDEPAALPQSEISNFCNQSGYSKNGNNGSVKDYFYDVSNGNLIYQNVVTGYVRMPNNKSYYDTPVIDNGTTREMIAEALNQLKAQGFNFSQISESANRFLAINIFYAGTPDQGWGEGLWPHFGSMNYNVDGVNVEHYQVSNIGTSLQLGTFVHENGHMICDWSDLYAYDGHDKGSGDYCLMSSGHGGNPQMPNPYNRANMGWITLTDISAMPPGTELSLISNGNAACRYRRSMEIFYIEARRKEGRSLNIPDEGLAIWHVKTNGKNTYENFINEVSIEQADGLFSLENNENAGGPGDLFHSGYKDVFNSSTNPNSNWYDGSDSGLSISNISAVGTSMSFTVGESENICDAPVLKITGTSANKISLSWNSAGASSYTVYYKIANGSWIQAASGVTATNYVITGLSEKTIYDIAVLSVCPDGSQPYEIITAETDDSGDPGLAIGDVLGEYVRQIPVNGWHTGIISASGDTLKWTNEAGVSWTLIPDLDNEQLLTTDDCPYTGQNFILVLDHNNDGSVEVTGFKFLNELYSR